MYVVVVVILPLLCPRVIDSEAPLVGVYVIVRDKPEADVVPRIDCPLLSKPICVSVRAIGLCCFLILAASFTGSGGGTALNPDLENADGADIGRTSAYWLLLCSLASASRSTASIDSVSCLRAFLYSCPEKDRSTFSSPNVRELRCLSRAIGRTLAPAVLGRVIYRG